MRKEVFVSILTATFILGLVFIQPALGQKYPTRTIELVCYTTAGGSLDILARLIADIAARYLGQAMVVVNKPGAGGSIACADVISSKADGYKLAEISNGFFATTVKTQKISFDPSYLVPLASFMELKTGMMVRGNSPWKTLNDLLDYAKKNPGKLRWGHTGRGFPTHMSGLLILRKAGAQTIDIPYKGSPEVIADLLGGHLDMISGPYGGVKEHIIAGTIRFLVGYSDQRFTEPANVPCAAELGFPEAGRLKTLLGVYVHKDTPENIKKILVDAFKRTYEDPEFKKGIEKIGEEPRFGGPESMIEATKRSEEVGVPIIKELGLYVEQKK